MKVFVKVTLNQSSAFEKLIMQELGDNRAGSIKKLSYEGILFRRFLASLLPAQTETVTPISEPKKNEPTGIGDIMGEF